MDLMHCIQFLTCLAKIRCLFPSCTLEASKELCFHGNKPCIPKKAPVDLLLRFFTEHTLETKTYHRCIFLYTHESSLSKYGLYFI